MATAVLMLFVLLLGLAIPVGIYLLTEQETTDADVVDRESAERTARSDGTDGTGRGRQRKNEW